MLNQVIFPPQESDKVAKSYVDWLKENPPDPSIEKTICIGIRSTEDGNIIAIGIGEIMKGKTQEALQNTTKGNLFMAARVPGLKYKSDVMLDFREAYKILGMTAPEKV